MKALIDTHTFLWWCLDDPRLSPAARELISNPETEILLSVVSAWEIAVKATSGKLVLPEDPLSFVPDRMDRSQMLPLLVTLRHALIAGQLPYHHRDPFDRMLVAQSLVDGIPIVTMDPAFRRYEVDVIW